MSQAFVFNELVAMMATPQWMGASLLSRGGGLALAQGILDLGHIPRDPTDAGGRHPDRRRGLAHTSAIIRTVMSSTLLRGRRDRGRRWVWACAHTPRRAVFEIPRPDAVRLGSVTAVVVLGPFSAASRLRYGPRTKPDRASRATDPWRLA